MAGQVIVSVFHQRRLYSSLVVPVRMAMDLLSARFLATAGEAGLANVT